MRPLAVEHDDLAGRGGPVVRHAYGSLPQARPAFGSAVLDFNGHGNELPCRQGADRLGGTKRRPEIAQGRGDPHEALKPAPALVNRIRGGRDAAELQAGVQLGGALEVPSQVADDIERGHCVRPVVALRQVAVGGVQACADDVVADTYRVRKHEAHRAFAAGIRRQRVTLGPSVGREHQPTPFIGDGDAHGEIGHGRLGREDDSNGGDLAGEQQRAQRGLSEDVDSYQFDLPAAEVRPARGRAPDPGGRRRGLLRRDGLRYPAAIE